MSPQTDLVKLVAHDMLAQLMADAARRITAEDIDNWFANDDQFNTATDDQLDAMSDYIIKLAATVRVDQVIISDTDASTAQVVPEITLDRDDLPRDGATDAQRPQIGDMAVLTDQDGREDRGWTVSQVRATGARVSVSHARNGLIKHLDRTADGRWEHTPGVYATFTSLANKEG